MNTQEVQPLPSHSLTQVVREIASLQVKYSSENTPEMEKRGVLIRDELPGLLRRYSKFFDGELGEYKSNIFFEGRDGIGRKTPAPWVRISNKQLSPRATQGYYLVLHFSVDGRKCFVTVGCASTTWSNERGDLVKISKEDLQKRVDWARDVINRTAMEVDNYRDSISIGSSLPLPRSFEKATAFCRAHEIESLTDELLLDSIAGGLRILRCIYVAYEALEDLPDEQSCSMQLDVAVNPHKKDSASRQGYGLTGEKRKAVEEHAMKVVAEFLESTQHQYEDVSGNSPYDYLASKDGRTIKVEVKGTTSVNADAILMTANEVRLHMNPEENTALAIVSGIQFDNLSDSVRCIGGTLRYELTPNMDAWIAEPSAYVVRRRG